ncbi:hypothetical protein [Hoyosella altamirensis]|uniref:Ribosomally synthesized peptide with SipW-like signal peptide n=1 Tax=Hoyosella altamirensis TaxID=616997 RepID=A0A839RTI8_9ACTN|nr:hypothetical protein [Hoyosella altamirensis]MBB3039131.1 hypothetical protein [Hoyosella altamirensis]
MADRPAQGRSRARKIRALAAAGVVLGTGATIVLAGWSESLFVAAGFGTAPFSVEGNVGNGWQHYPGPDSGAAELAFPIDIESMRPGDAGYAGISLRTGPDSLPAVVTLEGAAGSGSLFQALRYRVVQASTCNAAAFASGTFVIGNPSTSQGLGTSSATAAIALDAGSTGSPGPSRDYCFEISLPNVPANWTTSGISGAQLTVNWKFAAESTS